MNKHLPNSLRALFLSLAVLLSLPVLAVEVEIDGINYELVAKAKQATVIAKSSGKYSGEVVIPESVEHEGSAYSVTSIGDYAFQYCSGLTSVTIPNSVTSIGEDAFYNCSGLTSVHISDIAAWCKIDFEGFYSNPLKYAHHLYLNGEEVKDLVIPNSVTSIGYLAFSGCYGLTSVTIPNSVTSIRGQAFGGCSGLTSIVVEDGNPVYDSRNNCNAIIETATNTLHSGCKTTIIPNSVTNIGDYAFYECSGLTSVTIPNSVTSIGWYAFYGCKGLTSVTIGNSVTSIGKYAFADCPDLLDVYCYAEEVPSTESNAFIYSPIGNANLHVPDASIDSYKATAPWSSFGKIVALTEDETGIDELKGENGKVKTALYDLSGRRMQKGQKGFFIQNGKVMVR